MGVSAHIAGLSSKSIKDYCVKTFNAFRWFLLFTVVLYNIHVYIFSTKMYQKVLQYQLFVIYLQLISMPKTVFNLNSLLITTEGWDWYGFFQDGELVSVYDLQGRKIKKVAASTNIWAGLMSSLPSGTYILKSASKSIKFKN